VGPINQPMSNYGTKKIQN